MVQASQNSIHIPLPSKHLSSLAHSLIVGPFHGVPQIQLTAQMIPQRPDVFSESRRTRTYLRLSADLRRYL